MSSLSLYRGASSKDTHDTYRMEIFVSCLLRSNLSKRSKKHSNRKTLRTQQSFPVRYSAALGRRSRHPYCSHPESVWKMVLCVVSTVYESTTPCTAPPLYGEIHSPGDLLRSLLNHVLSWCTVIPNFSDISRNCE